MDILRPLRDGPAAHETPSILLLRSAGIPHHSPPRYDPDETPPHEPNFNVLEDLVQRSQPWSLEMQRCRGDCIAYRRIRWRAFDACNHHRRLDRFDRSRNFRSCHHRDTSKGAG